MIVHALKYYKDKMSKQIGFICVNFLRPEVTKNCILSLQEHFPNVIIYVADQDEKTIEMENFYKEHNIHYYFVEFDWGLSNCRNFLLEKVKEPYVMWGDNDFIFIEESNLQNAITLLQNFPKIGIVGGMVIKDGLEKHYEHYLIFDENTKSVITIPIQYLKPEMKIFKNIPYYNADLVYNFAIAPKRLFLNKKIRWNEKIKICFEHEDFFLRVKKYSDLKILYTPSMKVIHRHISGGEYQKYRSRRTNEESLHLFWNIDHYITIGENTVKFYKEDSYVHLDVNLIKKLQTVESYIVDKPSKIVETPVKNNKETAEIKYDNRELILEELKILNEQELFWFLEQSCLEIAVQHKIITKKLTLGVRSEEVKERVEYFLNHNKLFNEWKIIIEPNRKIKKCDEFHVPIPVVAYLEKTFNKKWEELKNG